MTLSELCIRRPVMTVLLSVATVIAGTVAYLNIPVAALPSFNTPVISVSASLPGASPENMASAVALPLEKEFSTIDGVKVISSTNSLGSTSITLEFNNDRDIDKAALASFSNKSEVLRKALQLYLAACEAKSRGLKIGFFEPDAEKLQTEVVGL